MTSLASAIVDFWFAGEEVGRKQWFEVNTDFDDQIRRQFSNDVEIAFAGGHDGMAENQIGFLALIIMLDQFPRNIFRGTARAFAGDARALSLVNEAVRLGHDKGLNRYRKMFMYLPFQHSESFSDQQRCIDLLIAAGDDEHLVWAVAHRDIIERFGRFPHRNAVLGRESTAQERTFLKQPNSSF